jgi:uracil-DNA glycosylase
MTGLGQFFNQDLSPFARSSGPRDARIALIGEAWGEEEERQRRPFVGASGHELTRMLADAGIDRDACFLTNVFAFRPAGNDLDTICGDRAEVGKDYGLGPMKTSGKRYLLPKFFGELARLREELAAVKPNIVVALGAVPCWALLGSSSVSSLRGTVALTPELRKVLPTYHPAYVLRMWQHRVVVVADLMKAKRHMASPELVRRSRRLLISPTVDEMSAWAWRVLQEPARLLSIDIETMQGQIDMIGFAASAEDAMVVPLRVPGQGNYWASAAEERSAWNCIHALCGSSIPKLFQNGLFDLQYLWRAGITVRGCAHDTMLLHHALYPEMQKGLGFMASYLCDESPWKLMRKRKKEEELKRDE